MKSQFPGLHSDFIGFVGSAICAIHCAGLPFLLTAMPFLGLQFLENVWIEYLFIIFSFAIAAYSLVRGIKCHKKPNSLVFALLGGIMIIIGHALEIEMTEIVLTSLGALTICAAHFINWRHMKQAISYNAGKKLGQLT